MKCAFIRVWASSSLSFLCLGVLAILLPTLSEARDLPAIDRLGRVQTVNIKDDPNILYDAGEPDTLVGYKPLLFDVEFILGGTSESPETEDRAFIGASVKWIPADWIKFGPQFQWVDEEQNLLDVSLPITFYLNTGLFSSATPIIDFNPFHFVTALSGEEKESHFTLQADPKFGLEIPQGKLAFKMYTGPRFVFVQDGETPGEITPSWEAAAAIILRPRPAARPVSP